MQKSMFVSLFLGVLSIVLTGLPISVAHASEVIGYSEPNFQGDQFKWKIPAGYRHFLVRQINTLDKTLGSITVGAGLKVKIFDLPNFQGYPGPQSSVAGQNPSIKAKSLIIYPASQSEPSGLQILGRTAGQIKVPVGQFFPLPEDTKLKRICIDSKRFALTPMTQVYLYGSGLQAVLYSGYQCSNQSVSLGGPGNNGSSTVPVTSYEPSQQPLAYMQNKLKSVRLEDFNQPMIPPAPVKVNPIQGQVIPGASMIPNLAGQWNSNLNIKYDITQDGNKAQWTAPSIQQVGNIKINGLNLSAVFQDSSGPQQVVTGTITKMLPSGMALNIEWDNQVVFYRNLSLDQSPKNPDPDQFAELIDINGTWGSSVGRDYIIKQSGNQFTWTVPGSTEQGKGGLNGNSISVSWTGPGGSASATGTITRINQKNQGTVIKWNNGVIFKR